MEEEKYQKELFEFEQSKKPFSHLTDILPKADFEGKVAITLTLEKIVFIFIGIMMSMVIIYALGVESGKTRARSTGQPAGQAAPAPLKALTQTRVAAIPAKNILNTAPIVPTNRPEAPVRAQTPGATKPYTILAASYAKREGAQASAALLTRQGFNATITYSAPYYRVCAGAYADKTGAEAQRDIIRIRKFYKDAMFKLK